jgi:hypothetical protein
MLQQIAVIISENGKEVNPSFIFLFLFVLLLFGLTNDIEISLLQFWSKVIDRQPEKSRVFRLLSTPFDCLALMVLRSVRLRREFSRTLVEPKLRFTLGNFLDKTVEVVPPISVQDHRYIKFNLKPR